jgi:hypothetical protein
MSLAYYLVSIAAAKARLLLFRTADIFNTKMKRKLSVHLSDYIFSGNPCFVSL